MAGSERADPGAEPRSRETGGPRELRDAFAATLVQLGRERADLVVLDADLNTSSKTVAFKERFPARFLQVGIAEQNLFGIAAGLALSGLRPVPSTFAAFAARRALDQIAISICYPRLPVLIPGSYVGLPTSRAGASHNCIEDIAVMRALPNMRVADPGDAEELSGVMRAGIDAGGPVYFRVARLSVRPLFGPGHRFAWGRGETLREGTDVTLFGTGIMSSLCLLAADLLAAESISAEVVHLGSIKPIDADLIADSAGRTGCAVTAENASVIGGFGAAVAETLGERCPVPLRRVGVQDRWVDSGGIDELFSRHRMQPRDIAAAAAAAVLEKRRR